MPGARHRHRGPAGKRRRVRFQRLDGLPVGCQGFGTAIGTTAGRTRGRVFPGNRSDRDGSGRTSSTATSRQRMRDRRAVSVRRQKQAGCRAPAPEWLNAVAACTGKWREGLRSGVRPEIGTPHLRREVAGSGSKSPSTSVCAHPVKTMALHTIVTCREEHGVRAIRHTGSDPVHPRMPLLTCLNRNQVTFHAEGNHCQLDTVRGPHCHS
jgi:hypothetical protein